MRENLREFIERHAPNEGERLTLVRSLSPRILITATYDFNPLYEVTPFWSADGTYYEGGVSGEFVGDWPPPSDALKCIAIRPLKNDGYYALPFAEVTQPLVNHLRALNARSEATVNLDLLSHAYIEAEHLPEWQAAVAQWRATSSCNSSPGAFEAARRQASAPAEESPEQRRARLNAWLEEERQQRGQRGALERVAKRENIKRQTLSAILKPGKSKKATSLFPGLVRKTF